MHTINVRQARAMSIIAPGTLAIREDSSPSNLILLPATDDIIRTGCWRYDIDGHGNVTYFFVAATKRISHRDSYLDLIASDNEARLELIDGVSA